MTSKEIRNSFIKYFEERGHKIVPSAPVIPHDDPTLLFTNAGMNQFKDVFLGTGKREYKRAADTQKCIRVSGKHNDLEEVGRDTYHHTFFEMLGNWSFGDYYKKEAIEWAWELLTKVWGLDKKRLYATVFESDDEAEQLWKKATDIDPSHVLRFGKKDNFWEMGETGPCGPCSEIHVDLTDDFSGSKLVNAGDPRVMEIWNLVFIQYNAYLEGEGPEILRDWDVTPQGERNKLSFKSREEIIAKYRQLAPLPAKHVDTGMGFERICAVMQGKKSNYDTDVFTPIINHIAKSVGKEYIDDTQWNQTSGLQRIISPTTEEMRVAMRVIADHARMLSFSIADGGIPSNEGRGYVMRRILRRAARFGRTLGMHEPYLYKVVKAVVNSMGAQFPEIKEKQSHIERVIKGEEESFNTTLDRGLEVFDQIEKELIITYLSTIASKDYFIIDAKSIVIYEPPDVKENAQPIMLDGNIKESLGIELTISGDDAFKLYDTYGFPLDLTEMMAAERGLKVDTGRFTELMERQRSNSRFKRDFDQALKVIDGHPGVHYPTQLGLKGIATELKDVRTYFVGYESVASECTVINSDGYGQLVLDVTPFYGESGGQVGDAGELEFNGRKIRIFDTKKIGDLIVHVIDIVKDLNIGQKVYSYVDVLRRLNIMRNHTATHLLHEALRIVLGEHLHQQGSLVAQDRLRFDFNHFEKITPDQIKKIEDIVNEKIAQALPVTALNDPKDWLSIEEAKRQFPKLKMFFGEKYGDKVRVVAVKDFCAELCGGTHVKNTKDIQLFKIVSEASIASGIRRIEAVTGDGLKNHIKERLDKIGEIDAHIEKLIIEKEELEKQLGQFTKVEHSPRPSLGVISLPEIITSKVIEEVESTINERELTIEAVSKSTIDLKKELSKYRVKEVSSGIDSMIAGAELIDNFRIVVQKVEVQSVEELQSLGDALRSKLGSGVGLLATVMNEKISLVCVVTDDLIKNKKLQAGKIVGDVAKLVGGGGGGRPHLATAGGKDVAKLDEALKQVGMIVKNLLN
jgi:alanyl-tRNA synthetase